MLRELMPIASAIALAATIPRAAAAYDKLPRPLAELSPSHFAEQVHVADDPLEPAIVFSTQPGYTRGRYIKGALADDVHLRALVDRRTGRISWQVWHELAYVGGQREVSSVHYRSGDTLHQIAPSSVEHRLDRCPPTDGLGSCGRAVRLVFELPERTVREIAQSYRPGTRQPWHLRFRTPGGKEMTGGIAPAEAAGLLQAVWNWQLAGAPD